jgi:hypothetical protein
VHALILATVGLNLQILARAASDVGIDEAWVITNNAGDSIQQEPSPDLVVAVLSPSQPPQAGASTQAGPGASPFTNLDVALRAGRSSGQGLPVVMIVPPPLQRPADLAGVVVASCPLDDFDALRLHLWAFVSTLSGRARLATPQPIAQPADFDATAILNRLNSIDATNQSAAALQVERLVASLLSQVGAELAENPDRDHPDSQVDLAILPSRDSGDIVLVEVKAGQLNETILAAAEAQLQNYVLARHAALGLVLYHDFAGKHLPSPSTMPLIIRMSVRELVAGLATNDLPQLITGVVRDAIRRM